MLRIGKNAKDQEENDHSTQRAEVPDYSTPKTYPSYQPTNTEVKPAVDAATSGSRAPSTTWGRSNSTAHSSGLTLRTTGQNSGRDRLIEEREASPDQERNNETERPRATLAG